MYKSSPFTFIFKFIFPVFMLAGVIFGIYTSWTEGTPESQGFAKAMITVTVWISIFLVQMPFQLKNIETTDKGIIIKDYGKETFVDYKDIEWITKFDLSSPWFITIKYHIKESNEYRKVSFMPSQNDQRFFSNDAMTEFIKNKIISENVNYSKDSQPSQIKNFILTMILSLPFALLAFYFMNDTLKIF
jgi:hypothetical protein